MMRYQITTSVEMGVAHRAVNIDKGDGSFTSFPAEIGNPIYDSFLELQSLTNAEVQAMEPWIWEDIILNEGGV